MKNVFISLSVATAVFLSAAATNTNATLNQYGQSDPVQGSWGFNTQGQAQIGLGTPTFGNTCQANGAVIAVLYQASMDLSGGSITIHNLGISIGATNCSPSNFQGSGSYTVTDRGDGDFEVNGTFTIQLAPVVGPPLVCEETKLNGVLFTMSGKSGVKTATITINGLAANGSYAERSPASLLSCTAPILNLSGSGSAMKF